ncbi:ABC transporter permease [Ancylobacter sp. MQZ15Z-1]|uniref:ABC transporter permease n=1 Tax=Ancylobacter mangrovi TaxID=2972472 RepID=A0A9X2P9X5_9HYPH|nr:ABC transporter permease [Ancylobacter mangrovi]MCS0494756.1 ABC transporter permease [Ancylobacter mangrovi]
MRPLTLEKHPVLGGIVRYSPLLLLAAAWEASSRLGLVNEYALPPLSTVLVAWFQFLKDPSFYYHAGMSLMRAATGLSLAIVLGVTLGISMASFRWVEATFGPIVQMFYPMPKSALIPLTILWFGLGHLSKIFLIFLGCLLPMTLSSFNGARGTDKVLLWSASSLGASRWNRIRDVVFPASLPSIMAGMRTALALAFVLFVSSELIIANEGLGYLIRMTGDGGQYPAMFAVVLTVVSMGFLADRLLIAITHRVLRWRA